jgi:hypothetical protein
MNQNSSRFPQPGSHRQVCLSLHVRQLRIHKHLTLRLLLATCACLQNGNIKKGPVGVGVRIQENMRVGPLKVEAVAAQVRHTDSGGWGGRGESPPHPGGELCCILRRRSCQALLQQQ